ncbi:hypothetical protein AB1Y20_010374 [Prymnesium parvum]|uniref:Calcineurin-like phosphoesterase domain-containing protein n=1 Tax=Prymnesium parvum TaxID=97485 RepID=A0AB34ING1_PRYPA
MVWRHLAPRLASRAAPARGMLQVVPGEAYDTVHADSCASLPSRWVVFSDLHVREDTLPACLAILSQAAAAARERQAGVAFLGDFWHSGATLSTRQLNQVLAALLSWGDGIPLVMIAGNHDQVRRGEQHAQLHALTPLQLARPRSTAVFSRATRLGDSLWAPYGTTAAQIAAACAAPPQVAAVFCHADIVGARMSETRLATDGLSAGAFPPPPARVYSGHYHKPHLVPSPAACGREIRYVGSPYETRASEEGQQKALLVLDARAGWAVVETLPLHVGRRHHTFDAAAGGSLRRLAETLRRGDRVVVLGDPADAAARAWRAEQLRLGVAVELRPPRAPPPRGGEAAGGQLDGLPPAQLFEAYAARRALPHAVLAAARSVLAECADAAPFAPPAPRRLALHSVRLDGFGSFGAPAEYPLRRRGLVLLQGALREEGGEAARGGASNGAGKTTLAMAPLWALTGSTDARAAGRPVEARGVICEGAAAARVALRGEVDGEPFEVERTMRARTHALRVVLGGEELRGTRGQLQAVLDARLGAAAVGAVAFHRQHLSAGLLEKTDAALKEELAPLLPLGGWAAAAECARRRLAKAKESHAAAAARASDADETAASLQAQIAGLELSSAAWERERAGLVTAAEAAAAAAEASAARLAASDGAEGGAAPSLAECTAALRAARAALDAAADALSAQQRRFTEAVEPPPALAALSDMCSRAALFASESLAACAHAKQTLAAIGRHAAAHRASLAAWRWPPARLRAAEELASKGEPLAAVAEEMLEVLRKEEAEARVQAKTTHARLEAFKQKQTAGGVCESCGQPVTEEHLRERHALLKAEEEESQRASQLASSCLEQMITASDAIRLSKWRDELHSLEEQAAAAWLRGWGGGWEEEVEFRGCWCEDEACRRGGNHGSVEAARCSLRQAEAAHLSAREAAAAAAARHEAASDRWRAAAAAAHGEARERRAAAAAARAASSPHALLLADLRARLLAVGEAAAAARRAAEESEAEALAMAELTEHFGKRGVQNLLYELATRQLEQSASRYAGMISGGQLQLHLRFDEERGSIQKSALVRGVDGEMRERSIAQLSGGEWRRLGLAFTLAFAELASSRLGVSCSYMVFDEVMQHMDAEGQAAMATLLKDLQYDTAVVIAHGLASDELHGTFDAIDIVEKVGDSSVVRCDAELLLTE